EEAALPTNLEPDDDGMFRERCEPNAPLHVDEQRFQVVVLILRRSRQPSLSPRSERSHEDRQLLARLGERVFGTMLAIDPSYAPTKVSACNRSESMVRDILGMPRRMSLKRLLPHRSSRATRRVQRPPNISWARATEQN